MAVAVHSEKLRELVDENVEIEQIATGFTFTEGPIWMPDGSLHFSDMPGDKRRRWHPDEGVQILRDPSNKCNGMTLDNDGNLIVCEHVTSSVVRERPDGTRETLATHWQGKELNSPNDVIVASDGSILFTDPTYGRMPGFGVEREQELDFCGVYRVSPDGELSLLAADFQKPNGLCFSPDEKTLWINDTDGGHIRRFSVGENHALSGGEVIYQMEGFSLETGIPDGQKLDANGNLWVSGPGGLHVVSGEGELLGRILTPENVGNQAWGGEDWKTLFICTSSTVHTLRTTVAAHRTPTMN